MAEVLAGREVVLGESTRVRRLLPTMGRRLIGAWLPVSYWKLSEAEVRGHLTAIAAATDLPIMVYNNPATSGIDLSPQLPGPLRRQVRR